MEKKYNLIHQFRLETYVKVDGQMVPISFNSGSNYRGIRRNGHFVTSDPELQKALETDKAYGSQWVLDKDTLYKMEQEAAANANPPADPPANPPTNNPSADPPVDNPPSGNQPANPPADPPTGNPPSGESGVPPVDPEIAECTNYTLAKNYLVNKFDAKRPEIISEEKLREYAKSKGITFPEFVK